MLRSLLLLISLSIFLGPLSAQKGYHIEVEIEGYDKEYLRLANYLLDNQYILDTAYRTDNGKYLFSSDTTLLPKGIYLVVTEPDNNYFQFIIGNEEDRNFSLSTHLTNMGKVTPQGSQENKIFYDYLDYLAEQKEESAPLMKELKDSLTKESRKEILRDEMKVYDDRVKEYQENIFHQYPQSLVSAIIKASQNATPPEYADMTDDDARRVKQWRWLQKHYFDNINLQEDGLTRTPFLFTKINHYLDGLTVQAPDSLKVAVDYILGEMNPTSDMFKFYVAHFTNKAVKSDVVGMDALYVYMIDEYYSSGKASWVDKEQLKKMQEDAEKVRPLLIGKIAPDLTVFNRHDEPLQLHGVEAPYSILLFWRYDCPACKKATPHLKEFYQKWKDEGVKIFAICTKSKLDEIGKCWEYVAENETGDWLHGADQYLRYYREYSISSTPYIFVLDKDKKIISKRLGAQQLDDFLTRYIEIQEKLKEEL